MRLRVLLLLLVGPTLLLQMLLLLLLPRPQARKAPGTGPCQGPSLSLSLALGPIAKLCGQDAAKQQAGGVCKEGRVKGWVRGTRAQGGHWEGVGGEGGDGWGLGGWLQPGAAPLPLALLRALRACLG